MTEQPLRRRVYWLAGFAFVAAISVFGFAYVAKMFPRKDAPQRTKVSVAPRRPPSLAGYVGSAACAECHAEISAAYSQTHSMARSTSLVEQATEVEDYSRGSFATQDGRIYRVEKVNGEMIHHEAMFDLSGVQIYDQAEEIAYVLGSGRRGRTFAIDRDGQLFQSPISWYAQTQSFGLAPGYQPGSHQRFDRKLQHDCLFCHVGLAKVEDTGLSRFAQPPFLEAGIACERCHGPGKEHVRIRSAGVTDKPDPIVNPGALDPWRRDSVCFQCHLRAEHVVKRQGRVSSDFRPGMRFEDVWIAYAEDATRGEVTGVVTQFRASTCYQRSGGKLGCITCHDPHSRPSEADRPMFYRQRCLQCHEVESCKVPVEQREAHPASGSCIYCHMAPTATKNIPHTALTDHRILRKPRSGDPEEPAPGPGALFVENQESLPAEQIRRAEGLLLASQAGSGDPKTAEQALRKLGVWEPGEADHLATEDVQALVRIGVAQAAAHRTSDAVGTWQRVLELEPNHEDALRFLTMRAISEQEAGGGLAHAARLAAANPYVAEHHWLHALLLDRAGRREDAVTAAEKAVSLDPTAIPARRWLAEAYQRAGQTATALDQQDTIQRILER